MVLFQVPKPTTLPKPRPTCQPSKKQSTSVRFLFPFRSCIPSSLLTRSHRFTLTRSFSNSNLSVETCWKEIEQQVEAAEQRKAICVDERFGPVDVRVFVSSTFADMFSEREVLIRKVRRE